MNSPTPLWVAFSRFGLGPDPSGGWTPADARARVEAQVGVPATAGLDPSLPSTREGMRRWRDDRNAAVARKAKVVEEQRMAQMKAGETPSVPPPKLPPPDKDGKRSDGTPPAQQWLRPGQELKLRLERSLAQPEALPERLTLFWSDHFTVGVDKGQIIPLVGAYEREALRPNIYAPFRELLFKAVTHPAMLLYLDNDQSFGPDSPLGQKGKRGLNENLGREILELHTLGVDGGYTQDDVRALAAVLSGWVMVTAVDADSYGDTLFHPPRHEPGPKTILGKTYPEAGADQLRQVLNDLARHPATARHVATRMCRSFISEDPPPALVARMADSFRRTDGNLAEVTRVMVTSDEAWSLPPRKVRPPIELLYVVSRLIGRVPDRPPADRAANAMGQPYFGAPSPKGWPDEDNAWATADGIKTRLDWARSVAAMAHQKTDVRQLVNDPLAGVIGDETRTAVLQAETQEQALTLLIMSPDLQRR